jgi:Trypsin-like peptidase domain
MRYIYLRVIVRLSVGARTAKNAVYGSLIAGIRMAEIAWSEAVDILRPHVVRIATPRGSGTGFLISNSRNNAVCGIATAAHVVDHAHYWEEPIRIDHVATGKSLVIRRDERAIFLDLTLDTAAILFSRGDLPLPADPLPLVPKDSSVKVGVKIGWLGFPAIPAASLCFFEGMVSAFVESQDAYLVDGVAINGVSGGPAFHLVDMDMLSGPLFVMGVVSAYVPNRATGELLPGLSVVRPIQQFHELAPTFASIDQAREAEPPAEAPPPKPGGNGQGDTPTKIGR